MEINIINQYNDESKYEVIIKDIISIAYKHLDLKNNLLINIVLVDNSYIQELNKKYRNKNQPTDVLSFENEDIEEELGDVFISIDKVITQSLEYEHSFERELAFLTLHGFLHCLGYDHQDLDSEEEMFLLQKEIIKNSKYTR
ncbi:MAG: rRNA maturation RNase YbeY [Candidatus Izimaplasma sp.]|nr:rRNA maturation RNase YbeY [Candidatus Izimaplasma bacterium]